jgi:hypothetical protein
VVVEDELDAGTLERTNDFLDSRYSTFYAFMSFEGLQ